MAPTSTPRENLRAALAALVEPGAKPGHPRLSALTEAFHAYRDARAAGAEATLDVRDDLPADPDVLSMYLEFVAGEIRRVPRSAWDDRVFVDSAEWRSGLQAMLDATGIAADVSAADAGLRNLSHEGNLASEEIPDVPPSHWWWWLPNNPPPDVGR